MISSTLLVKAQQAVPDPDPTRWINYSQTYFKIPIAQNGLYRITTTDLQRAGFPISQVNPVTIQLFHRGVEQAIYVAGETDERLDPENFVEFYGRGNDGAQDSLLYRPINAQPHAYYSLFNDTTAYFLTWRLDGQSGRRMNAYSDTTDARLIPETYHWAEELRLFTDSYPGWAAGIPPKIEYSFYEAGEGYTGAVQRKNKLYTNLFPLSNIVRTGPGPQVDVLLAGRDFTNHQVNCLIGPTITKQRLLDTVNFSLYDNARIQGNALWSDIGTDGNFTVSTRSQDESSATDDYSVSYIRIRYPQQLIAHKQPTHLFRLAANPVGRSLVNVTDVLPGTRFWDISDPTAPIQLGVAIRPNSSARFVVHHTDTLRTLFSTSQPKSVPAIHPVTFTDWRTRNPSYLIITHEMLMQSTTGTTNAVRDYAAYRASAAGGGYDTLTVTMQQLIDQYSYGERHPLAIRRFISQLLRQGNSSLQYLLLIGQSRSTPGIRHHPNQATLDMVMTAGFPGSDLAFTAGLNNPVLNGQPGDVPVIPTGRINAGTPQEVIDYLNKVKEYERLPATPLWRKNLLHLSGGKTPDEIRLFRLLVDTYRDQAVGQSLGARVTTFSKTTDQLTEPINVAKSVNEGVGLMTFFGHSGLDVTDLDIGFCSNDALGYQNKGRYPLLLINGCAIGNFFYGRPTLSTDWVLTPNRGAIAAIAQSHLGHPDIMDEYSTTFYGLLTDSLQLNKSIGQLQLETIRRILAHSTDGRALANCQQMVLQGDPAIRLFPFNTPDYVLTTGGLLIQDSKQQPLRTESDSVQIRAIIQNVGQYWRGPLPVRIRRFVNGRETSVINRIHPQSVAYSDTLTLTFPNERDAEGQNQFDVTINPIDSPAVHTEIDHTNNQAVANVTLSGQTPILIFPAPGSTVTTTTVQLTAYYATNTLHTFAIELDSTDHFDSPIYQAKHLTAANTIHYPAVLLTRPNTTYYWRVRRVDSPAVSAWVTGSFIHSPGSTSTGLPEGQIRLETPLPTDSQQGDVVTVPVEFTNLSPYPFTDSLLVQQTVYAAGLTNPQTRQWRLKAPVGNDTVRFVTPINTEKLPGLNRILLTVNPRLQPEYSFQNNTLDLALPVQPDVLGPLLEVAFDGIRITDGSIVSSQPVIDVLVADENRALVRRDTSGLDLFLQRPGRNVAFERLSWQPTAAQSIGADNVFRIRYISPRLSEGKYQLLATARDAVGNPAVPYQISFQIIHDRRLIDLTVHPNPFRDQATFAFTLTGNQPPTTATMTITDLTGRVIRHLQQAARIGLNEWRWNGRSDSGELLPDGVYIYKLILSDAQEWPVAAGLNGQLSGRIVLIH